MFQVEHKPLPHQGVIPGARGHKKVLVPQGTKVWVITYGRLMFWAAYQTEAQAKTCRDNLQASVDGKARRNIPLQTMLAWNFKGQFPTRVVRIKP